VKLFPNPSNGRINIEIEMENKLTAELIVYDLTGRVVLSQQKVLYAGSNTISMNLEGIAPGTYVLQMKNNDKQYVASFIIQ